MGQPVHNDEIENSLMTYSSNMFNIWQCNKFVAYMFLKMNLYMLKTTKLQNQILELCLIWLPFDVGNQFLNYL